MVLITKKKPGVDDNTEKSRKQKDEKVKRFKKFNIEEKPKCCVIC